jgi:tetratricopeptide (TPR) repeat protein/transcriptional regulator with XRE-family HTH domain
MPGVGLRGRGTGSDSRPLGSVILRLVRELLEMEPDEFAEKTGLLKATLQNLERGKGGEPSLATLERCMDRLGVSMAAFEELMVLAKEIREGMSPDRWVGPFLLASPGIREDQEFSRTAGKLIRGSLLEYRDRASIQEMAARDRQLAAETGVYLRGRENLQEVVREDPGCHLWSVAEWLCEESTRTAPRSRQRAAQLAEAALVVAELAPGGKKFRQRLQGSCWGHIGHVRRLEAGVNARRALEESDSAFITCRNLLALGEGGDPYKLIDVGKVLGMEAFLRRDQGRLEEAVRLLRQAMPLASKSLQPYLQVNYGRVLEYMGDSEGAIRILEEAAREAPRNLLFHARNNVCVNLCHLRRHDEAEAMLPEVKRLALETESQDNEIRVKWLSGRVDAGLGRTEEALGCFRSLKRHFSSKGEVYEVALVSIEIARLYLENGETQIVRGIAEELAILLEEGGIHRYAVEALKFFQEAALRETASVELAVCLITYLHRARMSPGVRFEVLGTGRPAL